MCIVSVPQETRFTFGCVQLPRVPSHLPRVTPRAMVKIAKAKRGFTPTTKRRAKSGVSKKKKDKEPLDAVEALVKQSASLSFSNEKPDASAKRKRKEGPKTNRSVVRRERKRRVAGSKRKQKRKGIN